jgi:hypothetical protein
MLYLFTQTLTSTYLLFNRKIYEQKVGIVMEFPLALILANYFKEDFELQALNTAHKKPSCWCRHVDDTSLI